MSPQVLTIVIALFVFSGGVLLYLGFHFSRAKAATPEMEERLERFGHIAETVVPETERDSSHVIADRVEKAVSGRSFSDNVRTSLARADLKLTVGEWILIRLSGSVIGFVVGMLAGRMNLAMTILLGLIFAGAGWMLPQVYLNIRAGRRQKAFVGQLGDTINLMANSLRAGYSLLQTMELVARESPEPMSIEFKRVVREVGLGISSRQALDNLMRRVPSEDLDLLVTAINIQAEVGGNLGQILDVIGETIRERVRIKGEIQTLTAQQSLSAYVISGLPIVLGGAIFAISPSFMAQMFVWPWVCMPIGASVLMIAGFIVMRRIVAIEV